MQWQPTASRAALEARATLLARTRRFFAERAVLEVETPALVLAPVSDVNLHSLVVRADQPGQPERYLHTSPEYAMKRLLAAGSGDIYQLCHVFRGREQGPQHNREFTLLEWYRIGFGMRQLIDEVSALLAELLRHQLPDPPRSDSYQSLFQSGLGFDPLAISDAALAERCAALGFDAGLCTSCTRDELLDLLMGARLGPTLGHEAPQFVTHYPAAQAALARLCPEDPRTALRFELYIRGVEIANGFEELAEPEEQRARFEADNRERARRGLPTAAIDERLLAALGAGLPPCSGVALGFDRLLMIATGATRIGEVLSFPDHLA